MGTFNIFDCLIITEQNTQLSSNQIMLTKSGTSYKNKTGKLKMVCLLDYSITLCSTIQKKTQVNKRSQTNPVNTKKYFKEAILV